MKINIIKNLQLRLGRTSSKRYLKFLNRTGVKIGDNIYFHGGVNTVSIDITRPSLVTIGSNISFNKNFTLLTHDWGGYVLRNKYKEFISSSGPVKIGNNIVFGRNVTVLKGVTIGDNCIIGLNSVITKDIPANSVAVGAPARVVSTLEDYYNKRKKQCIEEALVYAKSIEERFNRRPKIEEFWEEFSLFLKGDDLVVGLPIQRQMGEAYEFYKENNQPIFNGFDDFLEKAGVITE